MTNLTTTDTISSKIHTIRGLAVMLDRDLVELYEEMTGGEGKL
ncbi:MAG: hypothetical protein QG567_1347 [Campylobacterota bacterium]|nr:hypothetical protein [Campylobacterota bacterium]